MLIAGFYLGMLLNVLTCWSCIIAANAAWRITWACALLTAAALPAVLPVRAAYYFGILANVTLLFWSADTYRGKATKRWRGIVGGILLLPGPLLYGGLLSSWKATLLVPTVGHMIVSGLSWPFTVSLLDSIAESSERGLERIRNSAVEALLPRVATRLLFAALAYTGYLAVVYEGRFWFGPFLAFLTFVALLIGQGLRARGRTPTLSVAAKIALISVGTLFTSASILAFSALTAWVAFKAGFYNLFLGLANFNAQAIVRSIFAIILGGYFCSNMMLLYKLDRLSSRTEQDEV